MPEQRIQRPIALQGIRRTQQQSGCNGVGMSPSAPADRSERRVGFVGDPLERRVRKIELNDIDRPGNIPSRA